MTLLEAQAILIDRIGWYDDGTVPNFSLTPVNETTDSTRYFQDEHSAVTLENIFDTQPNPELDEVELNGFLYDLKKRASRKVLTDAFEVDVIQDFIFDKYPRAFDNLLMMQMVILVSELIFTSTRSNRIERLSKEFQAKLNYDINRPLTDNKTMQLKSTMGIATRYDFELRSVQRRFGNQKNLLKTITKGQVDNVYWRSSSNNFSR